MRTAIPALVLLLATGVADARNCELTRDLGFDLDAAGLRVLDLRAGAGKLEITGVPGQSVVTVSATACASSQERLDGLHLVHRVDGDRLGLVAEQRGKNWSWSGNDYSHIHLSIRVPATMDVVVEDGSGDATISGVASLVIDDGSGELTIESINGDVEIEDGSGGLVVRDIEGRVTIDDGSGDLRVRSVRGDVVVEDDGSGSIDIDDVTFNVSINDDGSGSIRISEVGGDVYIGDDGAGSIKVRDVGGSFQVVDDSNGGIDYSNVRGEVDIPRRERRSR